MGTRGRKEENSLEELSVASVLLSESAGDVVTMFQEIWLVC